LGDVFDWHVNFLGEAPPRQSVDPTGNSHWRERKWLRCAAKLRRFAKQCGGLARLIAFFKLTALPRTDQVAADFAGEPLRAWLICGAGWSFFGEKNFCRDSARGFRFGSFGARM